MRAVASDRGVATAAAVASATITAAAATITTAATTAITTALDHALDHTLDMALDVTARQQAVRLDAHERLREHRRQSQQTLRNSCRLVPLSEANRVQLGAE